MVSSISKIVLLPPLFFDYLTMHNLTQFFTIQQNCKHKEIPHKHCDFRIYAIYFVWSEWGDLNSRPLEPHSSTLPNCATPRYKIILLVQVVGLEPTRYRYHWILSPARLPIPPHLHLATTILYHKNLVLSML